MAREYGIEDADVRAAFAHAAESVEDEASYPSRLPVPRPATT